MPRDERLKVPDLKSDPVSTERKQALFQKGVSGNPAGRARGSRNKLGETFLADLHADWVEHGAVVIAAVRNERPQDYLKVVASIVPKRVEVDGLSDLSSDELDRRIRQLAAELGFVVAGSKVR